MQDTTMIQAYGLRKSNTRASSKKSHHASKEVVGSHLIASSKSIVFQEIHNRINHYNSVVEMKKNDSYHSSSNNTPKISAKNPMTRQTSRKTSVSQVDKIGAHLKETATMVFFQTPEKNLTNTESEMVLPSFDPSLIPSSMQNHMDTIETKKESKVPTCFQTDNKAAK